MEWKDAFDALNEKNLLQNVNSLYSITYFYWKKKKPVCDMYKDLK